MNFVLMKYRILILFTLLTMGFSYVSEAQQFIVYDTIPIRHGTSRIRLMRDISKWFESEKGQKLIAKNRKEQIFKGKGYFPYSNHVQVPDIYLSSHAAEKTNGSIVFNIEVKIEDSVIVTTFSNFLHEARFTEYGTNSFGRIMAYEKVPSGKCMEVEEWCNAVWADMKAWATYETKTRAKHMIPATLIRKRTFKVQEEIVAPKTVQPYDPSEYLKLENYLLKDTDGKYADYNKDPDDIAAEKAAAAAALAEKEKKKNKDKEDVDEYDEEVEQTESIPETPSSVVKEEKQDVKTTDDYDDYDDYDDEEEVPKKDKVKKDKSSKEKASKAEKAPKEKKSKKSDDDDDYDDYDDE